MLRATCCGSGFISSSIFIRRFTPPFYETVELANRKNRALINGVLRTALRNFPDLESAAEAESLATRFSHPEFLIEQSTVLVHSVVLRGSGTRYFRAFRAPTVNKCSEPAFLPA